MPAESLTDALDRLVRCFGGPGHVDLEMVESWGQIHGARVERTSDSIRVHFIGSRFDLSVSLEARDLGQHESAVVAYASTGETDAIAELADEINSGSLRREIDDALGWEPELAV